MTDHPDTSISGGVSPTRSRPWEVHRSQRQPERSVEAARRHCPDGYVVVKVPDDHRTARDWRELAAYLRKPWPDEAAWAVFDSIADSTEAQGATR